MKKILKYVAPVVLMAGLAYTPSARANSMGLYAYSGGTSANGTSLVAGQSMTLASSTIKGWSSVSALASFTSPPATENVTTVDTTSSGAGTLYIIYSVAGVSSAGSTLDLGLSSVVLSSGMTVQDKVYVNTASGGTLIDDTVATAGNGSQVNGTLSLGPISVLKGAGIAPGTPYTLTEELIITSTGAGETANFAASATSVPDGGTTVMLLGGAFCVIGAIRRKIGSK